MDLCQADEPAMIVRPCSLKLDLTLLHTAPVVVVAVGAGGGSVVVACEPAARAFGSARQQAQAR